ncbi:MAG TPA: bifunctional lysylphosphatidylglycerol flippase/synthetase MprF [Syntrophales bacterium]|nr:bifunctional lysylphosphatidylglycerol flippase/synthetase MprF [Syntrophales bacterium]HPQ42606.1 bifunctional lysylphosphatidylglycerol flippase/synthetase MprF [Syntrophales bacterium]
MKKGIVKYIGPVLGILLFTAALWVLDRELKAYHFRDILHYLGSIPSRGIVLAIILTFLSYFIMTFYDALALRYIRHPLHYRKIALASFTGYAFSNNLGFSLVAGSTVRYRLYSSWGFSTMEIAKVITFCSITLWLGFFLLGGIVFLGEPLMIPTTLHIPFASVKLLGLLFLAIVASYLIVSLVHKRPFKIKDWEFTLPSSRFFLGQMAVALMDWILAGSVLFVLLPASSQLNFMYFLGLYLLAQIAGLASQIPGGLGVFETVMMILLTPTLSGPVVFGSLVAYRGLYYLLPLLIASLLLGMEEIISRKEGFLKIGRAVGKWVPSMVPNVFAFTTFVGGVILLFSGATPGQATRLAWINDLLPLPIIEASHFLASLAGAALLLLARGLQRRVDSAYVLTIVLLGFGIALSLFKGLDYEEAFILAIMLGALLSCRKCFYRKASLVSGTFTPGWIAAIVLVVFTSIWLGLFAYKHVEYSNELWWHFTLAGHAPRFLRATVGILGVFFFFAIAHLLRPLPARPSPPSTGDMEQVASIARQSTQTYANLSLLQDKEFLFSENRNAFIMYRIEGRSWIAMGDPVGPAEELPELVWQFRELCERYNGWPVFYEVDGENLPLYLDLGLAFLKLGMEGRVNLEDFSLEGSARKNLRHTHHKLEREGCLFEVIPVEHVVSSLHELKTISDAWLAEKNTREKGFSLGFFQEEYLRRFPVSVVKKDGKIVAFANLWESARKEELSIDLMRYTPEAPEGIMEYLFIEILLWGTAQGYRWFNLGMAPLSGLEARELAPLWHRVGAFIFQHGEHFYNFQGLRHYKQKFDPEWRPKYLASPSGFALPRILTNLASLISGGLSGTISK